MRKIDLRFGVGLVVAAGACMAGCGGGGNGGSLTEKILFESERDGNLELYTMRVDGGGLTRLTNDPAFDGQADVSADGQRIVFTTARDGNSQIYMMDSNGAGASNLSDNDDNDTFPSFSNTGQIAFVSDRAGNSEIFVMSENGADQLSVSNTPGVNETQPCISRDGQHIVYLRDNEIWKMNVNGTGQVPLTNHAANSFNPKFSPDGSKVVYQTTEDGDHEVRMMNSDGSGNVKLTNNTDGDASPCFSPNGQRIVFQSNRTGNNDIYVMELNGANQTNISNNPANDQRARWVKLK